LLPSVRPLVPHPSSSSLIPTSLPTTGLIHRPPQELLNALHAYTSHFYTSHSLLFAPKVYPRTTPWNSKKRRLILSQRNFHDAGSESVIPAPYKGKGKGKEVSKDRDGGDGGTNHAITSVVDDEETNENEDEDGESELDEDDRRGSNTAYKENEADHGDNSEDSDYSAEKGEEKGDNDDDDEEDEEEEEDKEESYDELVQGDQDTSKQPSQGTEGKGTKHDGKRKDPSRKYKRRDMREAFDGSSLIALGM
jgi:hypothetical protein